MAENRLLKKGYAIYDNSVSAEDKYRVTSLPKVQFSTRTKAENYIKKNQIKDAVIFVVYGLPARMLK